MAGVSVKTSDDFRGGSESTVLLGGLDCEFGNDTFEVADAARLLTIWLRGTTEALQAAILDFRGGATSGKSFSVG